MNDNSPTPSGAVNVTKKYGVTQSKDNHYQGLSISSNGLVILTKVAANFNVYDVPAPSGISITTARNVPIMFSSMQWNGKNGLEVILKPVAPGTAALSLKSVAPIQNDWLAKGAWDISLTTYFDPITTKISLTYGWTNCGY